MVVAPALTIERLREALHYDPETGVFTWLVARRGPRPTDTAGTVAKNGYRYVGLDMGRYLAHRLAWFYMTGAWPVVQVDHRDLDRLNNSWSNLREATQSQNSMNGALRSNNTSGKKGVVWNRLSEKWQAQITVNRRNHYLGLYETVDLASIAVEEARIRLHEQFARSA